MAHQNEVIEGIERFVPAEGTASLMAAEHLARYQFASQLVGDRAVLDAACGAGYGTAMLARSGARRVTGVDIAVAALPRSSRGCSFTGGDLHHLPFADRTFDCVVCFEALEHVRDSEQVIEEFARVLESGGLLVLSTPNRLVNPPGNPYHVYEYVPGELRAALGRRFRYVVTLPQHPFAGSLIEVPHEEAAEQVPQSIGGIQATPIAGGMIARLQDLKQDGEHYTIALASNQPVTCLDALHSVVILGSAVELRYWYETLDASSRNERAAISRAEEGERRATGLEAAVQSASRQTAEAYQQTVSWRITSPLRTSGRLFRRALAWGRKRPADQR